MISAPAALALRVQQGDLHITSSILPFLQDPDWVVKTIAVETLLRLSHIGCEQSIRALLAVLQTHGQDTWVKHAAICALSSLASNAGDEVVITICEHLNDDSSWVQCAAMCALPFLYTAVWCSRCVTGQLKLVQYLI